MIATEERRARREEMRVDLNLDRARKAGLPATLTLEEWIATLERYKGMCAYCQKVAFEVMEHIIPLQSGGGTTAENCVPACKPCNHHKGIRTVHKDTGTGNFIISQVPGKRQSKVRVVVEKPVQQKYLIDEQLLTLGAVAHELGVSDQTVYNWLDSKALFGYHLGRLWRIPKKAVDEFLLHRSNGNQQQEEKADDTVTSRAARSQKEDS